ncbi:MAG: hypothetical protein K2X55_11980 [Burkholderiaceae bacterium]|nr:hypothetical protein [Burkholderiaceae bacterium]
MKISKQTLQLALPLFAMGLIVACPAHAAGTADIFDRLSAITGKLPVVKTALIYLFFLLGLGAIGWGGMEALKKSKGRDGGDVTWSSVGIKIAAGAFLVAITTTTDIFTQTFVGTSASSTPTNSTNVQ